MNEQHFDALPPLESNPQPDNQASERRAEAPTPAAEQPGTPAPAPVSAPVTATSTDDPAAIISSAALAPIIADDVDLIEKEWVEKAKQIVEQTKDDPYQQAEAITQVKGDYMKKRYNRELKSKQDGAT